MTVGTDTKAVGNGSAGSPTDFNALFWTAVQGTGPYQPFPKAMDAGFKAVGATLTAVSGTTAYAANNSISNNATAASVTALAITASVANDYPVEIQHILLDCNDTSFGGFGIALHLFNSDPTASTGVAAGDHASWSNKRAGYLGSFSGTFRTMSDGCVARLVPDETAPFVVFPSSGGVSLWYQLQSLSTTGTVNTSKVFIPTLYGRQLQPQS